MKIGLVGYGTIGGALATAIANGQIEAVSLAAVLDVYDAPPFERTARGPIYTNDLASFLSLEMDLVVEAASQSALKAVAPHILRSGRDLMVLSVGALADRSFLAELRELALAHQCRVYVPSGAIGGLDAVSAAAVDEIDEVVLTTVKPVQALAGADVVLDPGLDLEDITKPTCVYEGPAEEAVKRFPKNVNVAAALSLSGIGASRTIVRVVADPSASQNIHRIFAKGAFGELQFEFKNAPSPANPKTSYLASLSAIRLLKKLVDPIKIGT
jgi:aspartate dehydrogenase